MKKGSDLLVEALENEGVDRVFGVPGEENLDVVESLRKSKIELVLPDVRFSLTTDAGVFAGTAVDPGTKYLLLEGPGPDPAGTGDLLDLGCGYGPIACTLARRSPQATVWAVDVNQRARALCAANAERQLLNARFDFVRATIALEEKIGAPLER